MIDERLSETHETRLEKQVCAYSSYIYNRANSGSRFTAFHFNLHNTSNYMSVMSSSITSGSKEGNAGSGCLPFGRLLFSVNAMIISLCGIAPGNEHHDPTTVAALVDSSESECLILDTVSPP